MMGKVGTEIRDGNSGQKFGAEIEVQKLEGNI